MALLKRYSDLSRDERINLFQRCQNLLIKNQPDSPWILREGQQHNRTFFLDAVLRYRGFVYESENIIIMFNKHFYENKEEAREGYGQNLYAAPAEDANTYSIDFIASEISADKVEELKPYFKDDMKYITFLRGHRPTVFDIDNFKKAIENKYF